MQRLQSSMEFLTTYGWSFILLAVVTVIVFEFGFFNSSSYGSNTCLAQQGFLCSNPVLSYSGVLNITFGQSSGSTYNITGISCVNGTVPNFKIIVPSIKVVTGQKAKLNFLCPLTSSNIGTSFSGTLWIQYANGGNAGLQAKIANVNVKVTTSVNLGNEDLVVHYIPITLTNSQSSPTTSGFQQNITLNAGSYSQYENSNMSNLFFFYSNNTIIPSWMEGSITNELQTTGLNSSSNIMYWLKIAPQIAGSGGTQTIYLGFGPTSSNLFSSTTGEAPQLSASYGKYDTGANVFVFYQNFAGSTTPSGWGSGSGISYNNGIFLVGNGGGIYATAPAAWGSPVSNGLTLDYYAEFNGIPSSVSDTVIGFDTGYVFENGFAFTSHTSTGTVYATGVPATYGTLNTPSGSFNVFTINWNSETTAIFQINYGTPDLITHNAGATSGNLAYCIWVQSSSNTLSSNWIRERLTPPANTMPSVSFGTLT